MSKRYVLSSIEYLRLRKIKKKLCAAGFHEPTPGTLDVYEGSFWANCGWCGARFEFCDVTPPIENVEYE